MYHVYLTPAFVLPGQMCMCHRLFFAHFLVHFVCCLLARLYVLLYLTVFSSIMLELE